MFSREVRVGDQLRNVGLFFVFLHPRFHTQSAKVLPPRAIGMMNKTNQIYRRADQEVSANSAAERIEAKRRPAR